MTVFYNGFNLALDLALIFIAYKVGKYIANQSKEDNL